MRLRRRPKAFAPPDAFPDLTELQVAMLTKVAGEQGATDIRYARLLKQHVLPLPQGMPVSVEGRQQALMIAGSIASVQRLIATTGGLWMHGLPPELSPGTALACLQRAAYACIAIAAPDATPETILQLKAYQDLEEGYGVSWYRTVNNFGRVDDERIGQLLAEATAQS